MGKGWVAVVGLFLVGCEKEPLGLPAVAIADSALMGASSGSGNKPTGADCTAGRPLKRSWLGAAKLSFASVKLVRQQFGPSKILASKSRSKLLGEPVSPMG
jgi:hypothetical protein